MKIVVNSRKKGGEKQRGGWNSLGLLNTWYDITTLALYGVSFIFFMLSGFINGKEGPEAGWLWWIGLGCIVLSIIFLIVSISLTSDKEGFGKKAHNKIGQHLFIYLTAVAVVAVAYIFGSIFDRKYVRLLTFLFLTLFCHIIISTVAVFIMLGDEKCYGREKKDDEYCEQFNKHDCNNPYKNSEMCKLDYIER